MSEKLNYFTIKELCTTSHDSAKNYLELLDFAAQFPEVMDNILNLVALLNFIRWRFEKPIIINSGFRSQRVNKLVGGVQTSLHTLGKAADIRCKTVEETEQLWRYLESLIKWNNIKVGEIFHYDRSHFIHISLEHNGKVNFFKYFNK